MDPGATHDLHAAAPARLVYSLPQVADMTGFPLRPLTEQCRGRHIEHVRFGAYRGMTLAQVEKLIADSTVTTAREDSLAGIRARRERRTAMQERKARREARKLREA